MNKFTNVITDERVKSKKTGIQTVTQRFTTHPTTHIQTHFYIDSARRHTKKSTTTNKKYASRSSLIRWCLTSTKLHHLIFHGSFFVVADLLIRIPFFFHFIFIKIYINKCRSLLDSILWGGFCFVQMQFTTKNKHRKITFCNPFDNFSQRNKERRKEKVIPFDSMQKLNSSP